MLSLKSLLRQSSYDFMYCCTLYIQNLNINQNEANENSLHVIVDIKVLRKVVNDSKCTDSVTHIQ